MATLIDEIGKRYGRLTVVGRAPILKRGPARWICRCDCGETRVVDGYKLRSGLQKSCGCLHRLGLHRTHEMSDTKLYAIWQNMKSRCSFRRGPEWKNYGGRGVKVCDEWKRFEPFHEWAMSSGYIDGLSIERIDVNGNYCPENCAWIERREQALNKTTSAKITYKGETLTISEWSKRTGINRYTLYSRRKFGWSDEDVLTLPIGHDNHTKRRAQ